MDSKLLIKTDEKWYDQISYEKVSTKVARDRELELKREAEALLTEENEKYKRLEKKSRKSDVGWIRSVLTKGALTDKVAAHVLLLQNSAPHNLISLTALVQMSQSKGKREYILAMDRLKDLFLANLLPPRKLKPFNELVSTVQDKDGRARSVHLMLAYFEDQLRYNYHQFIEGVERVTHDPVPATKSKSINILYELLASNPEHEQFLLEKLVNKLGDPSSKVASHVSFLLQKLITENHPVMKDVVVTEVQRVLFRPNISEKAQYYCLCFLQGIVFTDFDQLLANKLIEIYFTFFKKITSSGDVNNKIMSALLSGMSRALPFSTLGAAALEQHLETFYKLIHFVNMSIAIQGLSLILSVVSNHKSAALADRYYAALWRFLQDHELEKTKKLTMLLNLLFKSMKRDKRPARVYAFIKKLTSVAIDSNPPFLASVIFLVSQILNINGKVSKMFYLSRCERVELTSSQNTKKEENQKEYQSGWDLGVRNPIYSKSELVAPWEYSLLTCHYHPSVALFAEGIQKREKVAYDGDPIEDFSLKHFLDRFVYRNPKEVDTKDSLVSRQKSIFGRQKRTRKDEKRNVDTKEYLDLPESRIPLEERFIYKYLKDKGPKMKDVNDEDVESVGSEEFEQLLDRFESDFKDEDFASELKQKKGIKRNIDDDDDGGDPDDSDNEMNFDEDDEYEEAFRGVKDDLEGAFQDDDSGIPAKLVRKFKNEKSTQLFESAEKFAHLLNDGESDKESDEGGRVEKGEESKKKKNAAQQKGSNFKKRNKKGMPSKLAKRKKMK